MDTTTTQLTELEKSIKIAEVCGAKWMEDSFGNPALAMGDQILCLRQREDGDKECLTISFSMPDYFGSLDAMHEAEKVLTDEQWMLFMQEMFTILDKDWEVFIDCVSMPLGSLIDLQKASAGKHAEAFGKSLLLWP